MRWEMVVGLEVHARLDTKTKLFSPLHFSGQAEGNREVGPICAGHPGALPVLNEEALRLALRGVLALGSKPRSRSRFWRKHYFYPDLPKGYQITQHEEVLGEGGYIR